jgi:outer membrane protein OmpA-like peptidoglycan-associated protein
MQQPPSRATLAFLAFAPIVLAGPAIALTLDFPSLATISAQLIAPSTTHLLATGPWAANGLPGQKISGAVDQTAYRIAGTDLSTLSLLTTLRAQIEADGYKVIYTCETATCGGFDFRYALQVLPEPGMHVDLGDFRYLSAQRSGTKGIEAVSLLVSRSTNAGFVQVTQAGGTVTVPQVTTSTKSPDAPIMQVPAPPVAVAVPTDLGPRLESGGAIALDDLVFASGAATLAEGNYASLADLATYLKANPARIVAIVGHTDASGGLDANIALSRKRAQSVRRVLIDGLGVSAVQVQAEGVGYLSPRASNLTDAGRTQNRRVEVMLTSTQ